MPCTRPASSAKEQARAASSETGHALEDSNSADWEISPDELTLAAVLGEGEFGIVYKGKWNGTPVAIKVVKASQKLNQQQLAAEVSVLRRIHHPNIVQFLGACTRKNPVTIVSEVMEGGSLADALQARPQPPLRRALEIALDCARGLNYLHLANPHAIIHRDLKPSNIMLTKAGTGRGDPLLDSGIAKLTDFGLSKDITSILPRHGGCSLCTPAGPQVMPSTSAASIAPAAACSCRDPTASMPAASAADKTLLVEHMFKMTGGTGSHVFMAGEIFRREPYNAKADVYSLAMVMYEMLAGCRPFADMEAREAVLCAARDGLRPQWPAAAAEVYSAAERAVLASAQALVRRCWSSDAPSRCEFPSLWLFRAEFTVNGAK